MDKMIWEGWTVGDFIKALQPQADLIINGQSWRKPFKTRTELEAWCKENQPHYKHTITAVVIYFVDRYGIT